MTAEIKQKLEDAGMRVDDALARFMNNEALLEKFIKKFLTDPSYSQLLTAVENKDNDAAFTASHTLKGVAANFSFKDLTDITTKMCDEFRAKNTEGGIAMMPQVKEQYDRIESVIKELYGE